jgi:hypothetical protein
MLARVLGHPITQLTSDLLVYKIYLRLTYSLQAVDGLSNWFLIYIKLIISCSFIKGKKMLR